MKSNTQLRQVKPKTRTRRGLLVSKFTQLTIPIAAVLALVASALLAGWTFAAAMAVAPTTVPTLLAGWVLAIGLTFALPLVVVRAVVAALD